MNTTPLTDDLLTTHLRDQADQALEAAGQARGRLIRLLEEGEGDLAAALADVTNAQPYAAWWTTVIDHIDHAGLAPITALATVRDAAHRALTERTIPTAVPPYVAEQAIAALEAARRFYHDTARIDLNTITGTDHATPTLTTPAITQRNPR